MSDPALLLDLQQTLSQHSTSHGECGAHQRGSYPALPLSHQPFHLEVAWLMSVPGRAQRMQDRIAEDSPGYGRAHVYRQPRGVVPCSPPPSSPPPSPEAHPRVWWQRSPSQHRLPH
eukprot:306599-Rhodomonas_salina.3